VKHLEIYSIYNIDTIKIELIKKENIKKNTNKNEKWNAINVKRSYIVVVE